MIDLVSLSDVKSFLNLIGKPITAITQANPCVITCPAHALVSGKKVGLTGINGMTILNNSLYTATVIDANKFSIGVNTTSASAYTGSGFVGSDDELLMRMITQASAWIRQYCNSNISLEAYEEVRSTSYGQNKITLYNQPVVDVYSLVIDGKIINKSTLPHQFGFVRENNSVSLVGLLFNESRSGVVVTYSAGYDPIPFDVQQSCIELVALRYREKDRVGQTQKATGSETIMFTNKEALTQTLANLKEYKNTVPKPTKSNTYGQPILPNMATGMAILLATTTQSNQVLDTVSTVYYRTIQYLVQVSYGEMYQMTQISVVTNGTTVSITEYGTVTSNGLLASFTADLQGTSVRLLCSPVNTNTTFKAFRTAISQ